jgi:hypothetical protein
MQYSRGHPVTKPARAARRRSARRSLQEEQERNRQRSQGGGQPNELGVTQGQNGEQGNTLDPRNAQQYGQPGSE